MSRLLIVSGKSYSGAWTATVENSAGITVYESDDCGTELDAINQCRAYAQGRGLVAALAFTPEAEVMGR